jgi:two-component system NarL family sensor kinase
VLSPSPRAARPVWQRPVVQFVVVGVALALLLAWVTGVLGARLAKEQAIEDARTTTELLASTVVEPSLSSGLLTTAPGELDKFDRLIRSRVLGGDIVRVKVWDEDGLIIYSDEPRLIGQTFTLGAEQLEVLSNGGSDAELSDLSRSENEFENQLGQVLEVYTRVLAPNGDPLLFELYLDDTNLQARADQLFNLFRPLTVGGILLLLVLTTPLVWVLQRRADAAAADRERYLVMATEASDAERRRVARDLHDSVVQDLAGTSFALSGLARDVGSSSGSATSARLSTEIERLASAVRSSLLALRSLLVEIYPPQLEGAGLGAALQDLVAPAEQAGVDVRLDIDDTERLSSRTTALVWRTAQECVRNATRHGSPSRLDISVDVGGTPPIVTLTVADDGGGYDTSQPAAADSFGLRGLRDLAREAEGSLTVESQPGHGTSVTLQVPAR